MEGESLLSQLYNKNVAVISEATIDFSQGLNVFTGETGAGKTILISAINAPVRVGRAEDDRTVELAAGETALVPAGFGAYVIEPLAEGECAVVKTTL